MNYPHYKHISTCVCVRVRLRVCVYIDTILPVICSAWWKERGGLIGVSHIEWLGLNKV
jgi:hypothetical protein